MGQLGVGGWSGRLICSSALLVLASCAPAPSERPSPSMSISPTAGHSPLHTSDTQATLSWGNKAFFDNCWGGVYLQDASLGSCDITHDLDADTSIWRWSWPQEKVDELKGYPTLFVGDKVYAPPGFDQSTDSRFPLHLPSMTTLWAKGDVEVEGNGSFDFAYDLAFLDGPISTPTAVRSEIMVWLHAARGAPSPKTADYTIDGRTYGLYIHTDWDPNAPYLAFVLEAGSMPDRIPLHEFISIGVQRGYVPRDSYLAAVELGPEIWWGEGEASIRNYELTVGEN